MEKYNSRNDVPEKYKWNLDSFYKNDEEFNKDFEKCNKIIEELKNYKGCTKNEEKLIEFLEKDTEASGICEDLYVYSCLINDQELGIKKSIERKSMAEYLFANFANAISFFSPELLKLEKEEYNKLLENNKIKEYKNNLDDIYKNKEHILNENEEIIVSKLVNSMNNFEDMSSNLLNLEHDYGNIKIDGKNVKIATNNYSLILKNKDVNIRKKAYNKLNKVLEQYSISSASYLNSYVKMSDTLSIIRKFNDSWDNKLFDLDMKSSIFDNLNNVVEKNINVLHKYYRLRKKVLKLDTLNQYDLYLNMSNNDKKYSIEDAINICLESIKPLKEEYYNKFKKVFDNKYIDFCQYKGKKSGAYSFGTLRQDSRILLSYNDDLDSISTIIHEAGHNVNHQFIKENNKIQNVGDYAITAEVASLLNECLLSNYLLEHGKTKEEKLSGIENIMDVIVSNLFGAVREGNIEKKMYNHVHNDGVITADYLNDLSVESLKKYYGKEVKNDKYFKNSWIRRSHYFMNFYLYSYAICISVACSLASKIIDGDEQVISDYIKFLKCGTNKKPLELFKILNIDLEKEDVFEGAIKYFDTLIEKYDKINNA